eukprot:m.323993 g.323993  ORF g.323993 m.323993 type:complete len:4072 (-) comp16007_c0_seq4:280-12495(-)
MAHKVTFWEGRLGRSFIDGNDLSSVWVRLLKERTISLSEHDESENFLRKATLPVGCVQWSRLNSFELGEAILKDHSHRLAILTRTGFTNRTSKRLAILQHFYEDVSSFLEATRQAMVDSDVTQRENLPDLTSPTSSQVELVDAKPPETQFLEFASRSMVVLFFSFLRQAARSDDTDMVQDLLQDALDVIQQLPTGSLHRMFQDKSTTWAFALERGFKFLRELSISPTLSVERRDVALKVLIHLALQTGLLTPVLTVCMHLLQHFPCLSGSFTLTIKDKFRAFPVPRTEAACSDFSAAQYAEDYVAAVDSDSSLVQDQDHVTPAYLLASVNRLSPPMRQDFADVEVYGWGKTTQKELGFVSEDLNEPQLQDSFGRLNALHISCSNGRTFVIDNHGKLWSCGEGEGLKIVPMLDSLRFQQVAASGHVLALTSSGQVYSWGNNSYSQLGRDGPAPKPTKITQFNGGPGTEVKITFVAVGGHHSAAVSSDGHLYTWGKGGYGRLGHGNSEDVQFPERVILFPTGTFIVNVACGLGDAHTIAVTKTGSMFSFGDGDFGKLGHGQTARCRQPCQIESKLDGTGVRQAWCGQQTSACLTNAGHLYTWGSFALGALGNGMINGSAHVPTHVMTEYTFKAVAFGFQRGMGVTMDNEVVVWGGANDVNTSAPQVLASLSGKGIQQVACGPNHLFAWSGNDSMQQDHPVAFQSDSSTPSFEAFEKLLRALSSQDLTASTHLEHLCICTLQLLERSFQSTSGPVAVPSDVRAGLRETLLALSTSHTIPKSVTGAAQFCVLQGWSVLRVDDSSRRHLLEAIIRVVLLEDAVLPTPQSLALANQLLRTRWRQLMPSSDRLTRLCDLLPRCLRMLLSPRLSEHLLDESPDLYQRRVEGHDYLLTVIADSLVQESVPETVLLKLFAFKTEDQKQQAMDIVDRIAVRLDDPESPFDIHAAHPAEHLFFIATTANREWATACCEHCTHAGGTLCPCPTLTKLTQRLLRAMMGLLHTTATSDEARTSLAGLLDKLLNYLYKLQETVVQAAQTRQALDEVSMHTKVLQVLNTQPLSLLPEVSTALLHFARRKAPFAPLLIAQSRQSAVSLLVSLDHLIYSLPNASEALRRIPEEEPEGALFHVFELCQQLASVLTECTLSAYPIGDDQSNVELFPELVKNVVFAAGLTTEPHCADEVREQLVCAVDGWDRDTDLAVKTLSTRRSQWRIGLDLPVTHPTWAMLKLCLAPLLHHTNFTLEQVLDSKVETGLVRAVLLTQEHLLQIRQTQGLSNEEVFSRCRDICAFLCERFEPAYTNTEDVGGDWSSSRARQVTVIESWRFDGVQDQTGKGKAADLDAVDGEADDEVNIESLQSDLNVRDWRSLVQDVASSSFIGAALTPSTSNLFNQITEMVLSYVKHPFELESFASYLQTLETLARKRIRVIADLEHLVCLDLSPHTHGQILHSMTRDTSVPLNLYLANIDSLQVMLRTELRQLHGRLTRQLLATLDRVCEKLCREGNDFSQSGAELRLLHVISQLFMQKQEPGTIELIIKSSSFAKLFQVRKVLIEHGLTAKERGDPELVEGIDSVDASSNAAAAQHLFARPAQQWQSSGRRGLHWITIKTKPGTCVKRLVLESHASGASEPADITVMGGTAGKWEELGKHSWSNATNGQLLLLEDVTHALPEIRLQLSAAGSNIRVDAIHFDAVGLATVRRMLAGSISHSVATNRHLCYVMLSASWTSQHISGSSLDTLCDHCHDQLFDPHHSVVHKANLLGIYRRMAAHPAIQRRFCSSHWTESLWKLFASSTLHIKILVLKLMAEALPGLAKEEKLVDIGTLLGSFMRYIAELSVQELTSDTTSILMELITTVRTLHAVPHWRSRLNELLMSGLRELPRLHASLGDDAKPPMLLLQRVLGAVSVIGSQSSGARVGGDCEHEKYGMCTVAKITDTGDLELNPHSNKLGTQSSVTVPSARKKSLSFIEIAPFNLTLATEEGCVDGFQQLLTMAFETWPGGCHAMRVEYRLLEATRAVLTTSEALRSLLTPTNGNDCNAAHAQLDQADFQDKAKQRESLEDSRRLTCNFLGRLLEHAVLPSPVRTSYSLQDVEDATATTIERLVAGKQLDESDVMHTDKITTVDTIEVSSNERHRLHLLDNVASTFWLSSGPIGSHWIRVTMKENQFVQQVRMRVSGIDGSYVPALVQVMGGASVSSLKELASVDVPPDAEEVLLLGKCTTYYRVVQLNIKRCHQGGCDTKVRGINVVAHTALAIPETTSVDDIVCLKNARDDASLDMAAMTEASLSMEPKSRRRVLDRDPTRRDHSEQPEPPSPEVGVVYAWGANQKDQFNAVVPLHTATPVLPRPLPCTALEDMRVKKVELSAEGLYVLFQDGTVKCSLKGAELQTVVPNKHFSRALDVSFGGFHALVLCDQNRVWARGTGKSGKLGFPDMKDRDTFEQVPSPLLQDIVKVAAARRVSAAISRSGQLFVWGCNAHGRLGLGDETDRLAPDQVKDLPPVKDIACGERHALALTVDGLVYGWGFGRDGRVGITSVKESYLVPELVEGLNDIQVIRCGASTSAAINIHGQLYVWGAGSSYRLGTGNTRTQRRPIMLGELSQFRIIDVSLGLAFGVAVTEHAQVYVWGKTQGAQYDGAPEAEFIPSPRVLPGAIATRVNRVACAQSAMIAWHDSSQAMFATKLAQAPITFPVQEDVLGQRILEGEALRDVEKVAGTQYSAPLLGLLVNLPGDDERKLCARHMLHAVRVMRAREAALLWLAHSEEAIDWLDWEPSRAMLALMDLIRLVSARRDSSVVAHSHVVSALSTVIRKSAHLPRVLAELCVKEVDKGLPGSKLDDAEGGVQSDELILTEICSLGLVRSSVDIVLASNSTIASLRLAYVLAMLWIRQEDVEVRLWTLARLKDLIQDSPPRFLAELQRLVRYTERDELVMTHQQAQEHQQQDDGPISRKSASPAIMGSSSTDFATAEDEDEDGEEPDEVLRGSDKDPVDEECLLTMDQFLSFNVSGKPTLDMSEFALLLAHRDVNCSFFQFRHALKQTGLDKHSSFGFQMVGDFLRACGLTRTIHGSIMFDEHDDEALLQSSVAVALREFSSSMWVCMLAQYEHERELEKEGKLLIHSRYLRLLVGVAAGIGLTSKEGERPAWYARYSEATDVLNAILRRGPFPPAFVDRVNEWLDHPNPVILDSQYFTRQMDLDIISWLNTNPSDLKMRLTRSRDKVVVERPTFIPKDGNAAVSEGGVAAYIPEGCTDKNEWMSCTPLMTSGQHYWTMRCDAKGSTKRYVGVGVGKPDALYPEGAARLLSDGSLKSSTSVVQTGGGFAVFDIVGVYVDMTNKVVAFDVNGVKRGEIPLPDVLDGEGVFPLVYMFSPGDKFSIIHNVPPPPCHGGEPCFLYLTNVTGRALTLRASPSLDASRVSTIPRKMPESERFVVLGSQLKSNRDGVWVRLVQTESLREACWCLQRDVTGTVSLELLNKRDIDGFPVWNSTPLSASEVLDSADMCYSATLIYDEQPHQIRAGAALDAMAVGSLKPGQVIFFTHTVHADGGVWAKLHESSKPHNVSASMTHLDAFTLLKRGGTKYFEFQCADGSADGDRTASMASSASTDLEIPQALQSLSDVDGTLIKMRAFVLQKLSAMVLPLLSFVEFRNTSVSGNSLGVGGSNTSLMYLQSLLLAVPKERRLKAVMQRTSQSAPRVTINLNRVQIARLESGLAGPHGEQSVFAQACRELRYVADVTFLAASRCWKVKFAGEGVDDAGGGYSESISEMCDELVNGSLTLLVRTPNGRAERGDNRDTFILNAAATSQAELELFQFLGLLIGIAIRTSSPISLPLAPIVWKQISGLSLSTTDLREVDYAFVDALEFVTGGDGDELELLDLPPEIPSSAPDVEYTLLGDARITKDNRDAYVRKAVHMRLHEFDSQVFAVQQGIARVVPLPILCLFTAEQLRELVVGKTEFDIKLLRSVATYRGEATADAVDVKWFWRALEELSSFELGLFLRFVWGRTQLPRKREDFHGTTFDLQISNKYSRGSPAADGALPEALTCFFLLRIPMYSSYEVLLEKLRYAIHHCKAIDTDNYARTNLVTT